MMRKTTINPTQTIPVNWSPLGGGMLGQLPARGEQRGWQGPPSACLSLCSLAFQASQRDVCVRKLAPQADTRTLGPLSPARGAMGSASRPGSAGPQQQPGPPPAT